MGEYSKNIPRRIAREIVKDKKHWALFDQDQSFWFSRGDLALHHGTHSYEGSIILNKKGKEFFKKIFARKPNNYGMYSVDFGGAL